MDNTARDAMDDIAMDETTRDAMVTAHAQTHWLTWAVVDHHALHADVLHAWVGEGGDLQKHELVWLVVGD